MHSNLRRFGPWSYLATKDKGGAILLMTQPRKVLQETPNEETSKMLASQFGRRDYLLLLLKRYNPREQKLEVTRSSS